MERPEEQALACSMHDNVWMVNSDKGIVVCAHVRLRKTLFLLSSPSCPVPLERLSARRDTIMQVNATTVTAVQDAWEVQQTFHSSLVWLHRVLA